MSANGSLVLFTCPHCGREVRAYEKDGVRVLYGHRVELPHTPETPWCKGGGERV